MASLNIYDPRERALVAAVDRVLGLASTLARPFRRRARPGAPRRILLLRLERIGDLLMALPAIRDVRALAPAAEVHLAVGSWNLPIARAISYVDRVETLDARWLARGGRGAQRLVAATARWRRTSYDLAINFEPDVRSNLLLAACGARWTAGWVSGGGGPLLDVGLDFDTRVHTTENARRLVAAVFERPAPPSPDPLLTIAEPVRRAALARLAGASRPLVAIHVSGGRLVKQWEPEKFAEVGRRLAVEQGATILLTGGPGDRALVDVVKRHVPADRTLDVAGAVDLLELAALLEQVDVLVTGDTGPMHLAAAMGTPVAAVFGPSIPARYAPSGPADRIVRVDLPCSPCNRIRRPPPQCRGLIPECLTSIPASRVYEAVLSALACAPRTRRRPTNHATA